MLSETKEIGSVEEISFEGGEPFLCYPILLYGVKEVVKMEFRVEVVSNTYWGTSVENAIEWLKPFKELKHVTFSLSTDIFHGEKWISGEVKNCIEAARQLKIPVSILITEDPTTSMQISEELEDIPIHISKLKYRGRAVEKLADKVVGEKWKSFTECPYEDLEKQTRVHIDPYGYIHVCHGITIGNIEQKSLTKIIEEYDTNNHPIIAPILSGGPAKLAKEYNIKPKEKYADACHLCYQTRKTLRNKFPNILTPNQIYGQQ